MTETAEPLVSLRDIHLTLESAAGKVHILRGISLDVRAGEAMAVVGPSGSGKSTMLMVLAGLERPSAGTIRAMGQDLTRMGEDGLARFRRRNVGIVFQSFHLVPTMTAMENVAVPLEFAGRRHAFKLAQAELEAVGLGHRLTHYPGQLSGGEQQRVAMARAVAGEPRLLLADEPTGNLDGRTGQRIMDLLFDLHRERGMTLILITHDLDLAARCSRIVHLRDGKIDRIETAPRLAAQ
jgi:putative ABC transport system ATP-binding protein